MNQTEIKLIYIQNSLELNNKVTTFYALSKQFLKKWFEVFGFVPAHVQNSIYDIEETKRKKKSIF